MWYQADCPYCGKPLKQMVQVWLWCDAKDPFFHITKEVIRKKGAKLSHVDYPPPDQWVCTNELCTESRGTPLKYFGETPETQKENDDAAT